MSIIKKLFGKKDKIAKEEKELTTKNNYDRHAELEKQGQELLRHAEELVEEQKKAMSKEDWERYTQLIFEMFHADNDEKRKSADEERLRLLEKYKL